MAKLEVLPKRLEILDVNSSDCKFRINIDVLNEAFGVGRAMYAKAVYPDKKDTYILGNKPGDKFIIWMPKLYGNSSEWRNVLSEDGTELYEVAEPTRHEDWLGEGPRKSGIMRLVFVKDDPKSFYRFVGVFAGGNMEHLNHTFVRIASKVKLIGIPVTKIELLDDNR